AVCIERGTTPQQRTVVGTLGTIAALVDHAQIQPPALTVLGEVVNLRPEGVG
ncbi:MAG: uroporphyrin-III C-methyltransferase, partial [Chitinophagaceae bacterium]|nr:uroporphyrin-III C-methyltransferase [Anaerolineae bacterium]